MRVRGTTGAGTRLLAALTVVGVVPAGLAGAVSRTEAQEAISAAQRPNVVVITTDDQDAASLRRAVMPNLLDRIRDRGTLFTASFSSPPLCCPSRAGFLTGQYPHNHGVFDNNPGYPKLRGKADTLPRWLRRSGYRTGFVGKFLNGYTRSKLEGVEPAPGFDRWYAVHRRKLYYRYQMTINGRVKSFGAGKRDYLTKVITRYSTRFIKRESRRGTPFFLWSSYWAPHYSKQERVEGPCDNLVPPGPGDEREFADAELPRPPSFDEADVRDKPPFVRNLRRISGAELERLERSYRCRLASLLAVDRGVNAIVKALDRAGELDRTVLVFTSDNGFYHGEHRITHGKATPYEPAIRVPLAISVPDRYRDGPRAEVAPQPVSNVDLAPTILDLARASACKKGKCRPLDGRSLVPLLSEGAQGWPEDRGILFETRTGGKPCRYEAIRTARFFYAEHGVGGKDHCRRARQKELYDLDADPHELDNLLRSSASPPQGAEDALRARLAALRRCSGVAGRDRGGGPRCE